ncbi:hypothetical protein RhiirA4_403563 [Rhizophagus irregularis]|uniref:Uncharacterized protein n=1 Tax=Rhizophagus irregularis TaxID=588596 RepID=A0A2I1GLU6_9GLOM|nr:hypothetical protein RhiirA4_403563 [Rhizophagus irregularis]
MATILVQELIRICLFRLKVQEPAVEYKWFPYNHEIDPNLMEGREDIDENNNLLVELCSFPLFVSNYGKQGQKVYSRAYIVCQVNGTE